MASIQHLYRGAGDPNDNPDLELTGDAVGNHLYQDVNDSQSVWISTIYKDEDEGNFYHDGWQRLLIEPNLGIYQIELNQPMFEGEMGISRTDETLFIAMWDQQLGSLRWRSAGITMGDWYEEPAT